MTNRVCIIVSLLNINIINCCFRPVCRNCVVSPTGSSPPPLQEQSPPPPAPSSPHQLFSPQPHLSPQSHLPPQSHISPPHLSPLPSHSGSSVPSTSNSPHPYPYSNRRSQYQDYPGKYFSMF